jgi:hypothetical protein
MKTLIFLLLFIIPPPFQGGGRGVVDISNNYWGSGIDPQSSSPSAYWPGFNFSASSAASAQSSNAGLSCSDDDDLTKQKGVKSMAIATDTDTCSTGFPDYVAENNSNFQYRQDYDTMRYWYIPHCYPIALAPETAGALGGSANPTVLTTIDSVLNYRNFIIHCLTLRNDDEWFCAFVGDLAGTYRDSNNIYNGDYRAGRAIFQYLADNPRCAYVQAGDQFEYNQLTQTEYQIWMDTSHDGENYDTTLPTMQDLGLDTVLIINGQAGVTYAVPTPQIIMSARVLDNPFPNSTSILVSIGREAYVTIAVYNVLGEQIAGAGYAGVFEQGSRTIPLDMTSAPSGAYYVRISTANNETQTLKLTKE